MLLVYGGKIFLPPSLNANLFLSLRDNKYFFVQTFFKISVFLANSLDFRLFLSKSFLEFFFVCFFFFILVNLSRDFISFVYLFVFPLVLNFLICCRLTGRQSACSCVSIHPYYLFPFLPLLFFRCLFCVCVSVLFLCCCCRCTCLSLDSTFVLKLS